MGLARVADDAVGSEGVRVGRGVCRARASSGAGSPSPTTRPTSWSRCTRSSPGRVGRPGVGGWIGWPRSSNRARATCNAASLRWPSTTASGSTRVRPGSGNRKGVVEKSIDYLTQSWWRTARIGSPTACGTATMAPWCPITTTTSVVPTPSLLKLTPTHPEPGIRRGRR